MLQNFMQEEEVKDEEKKQSTELKLKSDKDLVIEDLFGKIFGIERVLLLKKQDTLRDVIEKITLIPESKLVYIDVEQGYPKMKNMLSLSDVFEYLGSKN